MAAGSQDAYNEVFEDSLDGTTSQSVHRLRANSSVLKLDKILGQYSDVPLPVFLFLLYFRPRAASA